MSAIINAGENLMLDRQASIAQTKTQGGRRLSQKRGPLLYNLEVDVPAQEMNQDRFFRIEKEVIDMQYGALDFQSAKVSGEIGGIGLGGNGPTSHTGVWTGTPVISGSSNSGTTVVISTGLSVATTGTPEDPSGYYARAFDYVQFPGSTKVYQVIEDVNSKVGTGLVTLRINSPLVNTPPAGQDIEFGGNVNFNFALMERPKTTYQPGGIVQYGTFVFEEVILDITRLTGDENNSNPPGNQAQQIFYTPTVLSAGMTGPTGPQGDRGFTWFNATGVPTTVTNSVNGDYYLDTGSSEPLLNKVYKRIDVGDPLVETWVEQTDLTGETGPSGSIAQWDTDETYTIGTIVISDDRIWEAVTTRTASDGEPENETDTTNWKEVSSSQSAADDAIAFAIALG